MGQEDEGTTYPIPHKSGLAGEEIKVVINFRL